GLVGQPYGAEWLRLAGPIGVDALDAQPGRTIVGRIDPVETSPELSSGHRVQLRHDVPSLAHVGGQRLPVPWMLGGAGDDLEAAIVVVLQVVGPEAAQLQIPPLVVDADPVGPTSPHRGADVRDVR